MDNSALTQQTKALLLGGAGLLIAIFLGMQIGGANYSQLLFGTAVVAVVFVSFFSGRFFWVLTIASSFLGGTFPILGGSFTTFQILMAIGVGKFVIEDVVMRRVRIKIPTRVDALLIAGFMGILTWHGVHDRFGMRFLGSSVWGGRNYVNVFVGLAAFFIVQSIPMKSKIWAKLPYLVLAVTGFDLVIAVLTTLSPNLIYKIYPFYSAVSTLGIEEIVGGRSSITERIGGFGNFGYIVITLVLASISVRQILSPSNFSRHIALVIGSLAILYSGFRTAVINSLVVFLAAGIRDLKWAVFALLPFIAILLFALSVVNSEFFTLPKQVQRSLTFIPGTWDTQMMRDAASSNEFRQKVWTVFVREYFPAHPLIGRGFGFRSQMAERSVYKYNPNWDRETIEVGNIHNGFLATLDALGVVGTIFFLIWNVRLLVRTFQVSFDRNNPAIIALRFLGLYLAVLIITYWAGAATVGTFLPQEFALAGVFLRLQKSMDSDFTGSQPVKAKSQEAVPAEPASA